MVATPVIREIPFLRFLLRFGLPDSLYLLLFGFSPSDVIPQGERPHGGRKSSAPSTAEIERKLQKWLEKRANKSKDFTLAELADKVKISDRFLRIYFRDELHTCFRQWKMKVRMQEALDIMKSDPYRTIGSIAKQLGYEDKTNFLRQFRRATGCTPKQWRMQNNH
ncbi:MAG: helix-turn-helix transcriptional regulator [Bacteroidales bacterium]|nr:helix-turn-helix transcriptional regulator [Bacteroidales bacterium]